MGFWNRGSAPLTNAGAVTAAVVGVGYLGQYHAEKYAGIDSARLVAVVDTNQSNAQRVAKKLKTEAITDYRELPKMGVQCASIVSDTQSHYEIAAWLLQHGVDVLVEKPMTTTVEEAQHLIEIARSNNRILQVGHLERFNPAFREMRKVLNRPGFFEVRRIAPFTGRGADVDVVLDLMIHDIDIVSHLVGKPLESVEAVGIPVLTNSVDVANARITFEGGAIANFTASRAALKSERTVRVFQPDVYISLDYGKKKLKIYTNSGEADDKGLPRVSVREHKIEERDALNDEILAFVSCVESRSEPEVSGEDGMRALQLADRIRKTLRSNMESRYPDLVERFQIMEQPKQINASR